MTCSDILTMACNLLSEESGSTSVLSDFSNRAPYILASFCGEAKVIDKRYREAFKLGTQPIFDRIKLGLDKSFPLCDRLIPAAAFYLGSMLIIDENPSLSQSFAERCRDSLAAAYDEIPCVSQSIKNVY